MSATVIWRPEAFNARLVSAARPAAQEVAKAAQVGAARASRRVAASIRVTGTATNFLVGAAHPLGVLFEKGVGPHEIEPRGGVLRLADGRFVTGGVRHPGMPAKPYLEPAMRLWPTLYRRMASELIRGF